jgi:hypothetical protein
VRVREKTDVSKTIFVLFLNQTSTLRTRTEMVFETLVFSPLNHLTRLIARENFIIANLVYNVLGGTCSTHGGCEKLYKILIRKSELNTPLRSRRRWQCKIKTCLKEMGGCWYENVDTIHLDQDRYQWRLFVNTVMNLWCP